MLTASRLQARTAMPVFPIPEPAATRDGAAVVEPPLQRLVARLAPVGLAELGGAALMERVDTKFLLPRERLLGVVRECALAYRVLEVAGTRLSRYETLYYDTDDLALYHAHHGGRATRRKVRCRTYVDSDRHFLEVKLRGNTGRTRKARVPVDAPAGADASALAHLTDAPLRELAGELDGASLRPVVRVDYTRLTLVRRDGAERVTLDLGLAVVGARGQASFPGLVVAEVKQARRGGSPLVDALRAFGVREGGLSKYCLGVATLEPGAKTNRFKPRLHDLYRAAGIAADSHAAPLAAFAR